MTDILQGGVELAERRRSAESMLVRSVLPTDCEEVMMIVIEGISYLMHISLLAQGQRRQQSG